MQTKEEIAKKYQRYIDSLEWHVKTNLNGVYPYHISEQLIGYREVLADLEAMERYASGRGGRDSTAALKQIELELDTVNLSSHAQMKEAIQTSLELTQTELMRLRESGESYTGQPAQGVELHCMYCEARFIGAPPKTCCSGKDCGCMGLPIEPVVCSKGCYEMLMNKSERPITPVPAQGVEELWDKHSIQKAITDDWFVMRKTDFIIAAKSLAGASHQSSKVREEAEAFVKWVEDNAEWQAGWFVAPTVRTTAQLYQQFIQSKK